MADKTNDNVSPRPCSRHPGRVRLAAMCGLAAAGHIAFSGSVWSMPLPGKPGGTPLTNRPSHATPAAPGALLHRVQIVGSDFMVMNVSGKADEPLLLKIALPMNPTGSYSFLMFRGLPPKFSLSAGFPTKNQWAVSLSELNGLRIIPPPGYTGSFNLEVLLMKSKEGEPESRTLRVEFLPVDAQTASQASSTSQTSTTGTLPPTTHASSGPANAGTDNTAAQHANNKTTPPAPREMTDDDRLMLERGDLLFRQGDVAAARLIYNRMAKQGIAAAALAMGRTYDAEALKPLKVEGLQPDAAQARVWYKLAADLGNQQAKNRLLTLRDTD